MGYTVTCQQELTPENPTKLSLQPQVFLQWPFGISADNISPDNSYSVAVFPTVMTCIRRPIGGDKHKAVVLWGQKDTQQKHYQGNKKEMHAYTLRSEQNAGSYMAHQLCTDDSQIDWRTPK